MSLSSCVIHLPDSDLKVKEKTICRNKMPYTVIKQLIVKVKTNFWTYGNWGSTIKFSSVPPGKCSFQLLIQ
jgi:hypothetical protein